MRWAKARFTLALIWAGAAAQYMPDEIGRYQGWRFVTEPSNVRDSRATPADLKAMEANVRKLEKLILAAPVLNPPKGFEIFVTGVLMAPDPSQARMRTAAGLPLDIWVRFGTPEYSLREGKRVVATDSHHLNFWINDLRPVLLDENAPRKWEDETGDIYLEPAVTSKVGGFPVYKDMLAVTRPGESIWAPVPAERFLKMLIKELKNYANDAEKSREQAKRNLEIFRSPAEQEKRRKEMEAARQASGGANEVRRLEFFFKQDEEEILKKANPDPATAEWYYGPVGALKDAEGKLAGLDAAGRQGAACVTGFEAPGRVKVRFVPAGTAGCRAIVQANLGVFHPKLPRSAIQLIGLDGIEDCRAVIKSAGKNWKNPGDCTATLAAVEQIDWKQVASLLEP